MAKSREDFLEKLPLIGVEGEYRTSENGRASKLYGDYVIYELTDTSGFGGKIPGNLKCKSYKLGAGYGFAALDEKITENNNKNMSPAVQIEDTESITLDRVNFMYDSLLEEYEQDNYEN